MKYNKQTYRVILEQAIDGGYKFVDYLSVDFAPGADKQIILRHDIDCSPAIALEMAEIDASYNIKATFAVLVSSPLYNPFALTNIGIINKIHQLGHNIALHHPVLPGQSDKEIQQNVAKEIQIMGTFFPYIQPVFIWHNLPQKTLLSQIEIHGMVNAYSTKFVGEMEYISDSVTRHTPEEFLNVIGKYRLLHILFHPLIWMTERDNMVAMISCALAGVIRDYGEEFLPISAWREKFPNGIPQRILKMLEELLAGG